MSRTIEARPANIHGAGLDEATWVIAFGPPAGLPLGLAAAVRAAGWDWISPSKNELSEGCLPPWRVVLLLVCPELDHAVLTLLRRVSLAGGPPTIVLSPVRATPIAVAALRAGADDFISTPCTSAETVARIGAVLRGYYRVPMERLPQRATPGPRARGDFHV